MMARSKIQRLVAFAFVGLFALVTTAAVAQEHEEHTGHAAEPAPATGHLPEPTQAAPHHEGAAHEGAAHEGAAHEGAAAHHEGAAHEGGHEGAAAHHEGGHHGPEPINWTDLSDKKRPAFIALLINFGLLAALYYTMGKKPVVEGLKQRRVTIGQEIEDARAMLKEAEARAEKYQAKLKNVDTDAASAKAALITSGKGEVDEILLEAQQRAERMARDATRLVEQERKQLQQDLLIETVELAAKEAQELLERNATPEDHARLANELLQELSRKPAGVRASGGVS